MKKFMFVSVIVYIIYSISGCGIFDLRDPEPPGTDVTTLDPLNIADILGIVRESAVDMDYKDYFTPDVRFEYSHFREISGRDNLIHMLNRLRARAAFVEWQTESGDRRPPGANLQIIHDVPYTVRARDGNIYTGLADFHIVRTPDWMISYWKDRPDEGSEPFFEQ